MILVCIECHSEYEWDESPSDLYCAECSMRRAAIYGVEDES